MLALLLLKRYVHVIISNSSDYFIIGWRVLKQELERRNIIKAQELHYARPQYSGSTLTEYCHFYLRSKLPSITWSCN
jgi:hypothetical protein